MKLNTIVNETFLIIMVKNVKINKPLINFQSYLKFNAPLMPDETLTSEQLNEALLTKIYKLSK